MTEPRPWQKFKEPTFESDMVANSANWSLNQNYTKFFQSLLTSVDAYSSRPNCKTKVFPLFANIFDASTDSKNLVIRPEQEKALHLAIKLRNEFIEKKVRNSIVLLTGSPGIGKSWSALYYMRLLAESNNSRPILYEFGTETERHRVVFVPPHQDGTNVDWVAYSTNTSPILNFPGFDLKKRRELDVVIDPLQGDEGEDAPTSPFIEAFGHVFVPKPPNAKYPGSHRKLTGGLQEVVLNPCSLSSILEVREPMGYPHVDTEDVKLRYHRFGGLPRYIFKDHHAMERWKQIQKSGDQKEALLSALSTQNLTHHVIQSCFFARRMPNGFGLRTESNDGIVGFVSLGAIEVGGRLIWDGLQEDTVWRNSANASAVGLAFERVVLTFLMKGDKGMESLGVQVTCRELLDPAGKSGNKKQKLFGNQVGFSLAACDETAHDWLPDNRQDMTEIFSAAEFYKTVADSSSGLPDDGLVFDTNGNITCSAPLTLAPVGHAVSDGMCGRRVHFNSTLQKGHGIKGAAYITERKQLGLTTEKSIMVFVVPEHRFHSDYNNRQLFDWTSGDKLAGEGSPTPGTKPNTSISEKDKAAARKSLSQYVLHVSKRKESVDVVSKSMESMDILEV